MGDAKLPPPPPPVPPSFMAFSPPRSYSSLFLASDNTSYACEICLNYKEKKQKYFFEKGQKTFLAIYTCFKVIQVFDIVGKIITEVQ